jgi:hypothetical protein
MRPGSIPSGPGKGKFPVTNQHQANSAAKLIGHAKGVSKKRVRAHIIAQAKARGLKVPTSLSEPATCQLVDLNWQKFDELRGYHPRQSVRRGPGGVARKGGVAGHPGYTFHVSRTPGHETHSSMAEVRSPSGRVVGHVGRRDDGSFAAEHAYGSPATRQTPGSRVTKHSSAQSAMAEIAKGHKNYHQDYLKLLGSRATARDKAL